MCFWDYVKAREVWDIFGISFNTRGVGFQEFVDLLWHLKCVEQQGDEILEVVITVAWCLWFNINEARLGKARAQASAILHKACYLLEFQVANFRLSSPVNNGEVLVIIRYDAGRVEAALSKLLRTREN
nr:hypothetical protein CFP56_14071 [Quercus suber]